MFLYYCSVNGFKILSDIFWCDSKKKAVIDALTDNVRLEVGLDAVLADLLEHSVGDVVLVEVDELLDEVLVACG